MLTAQTHGAALVAAKLTAKAVLTWIFFVLAFTHFYYGSKISLYTPHLSPLLHGAMSLN